MEHVAESSDVGMLDLLRSAGPLSISALSQAMGVTPTAVRQRLARLTERVLVERALSRAGRGRPSHRYALTEKGRRQSGANFADLAIALWREIRSIEDPQVRRGLLQRLATTLVGMYANEIEGATVAEKMQSVSRLFERRDVPIEFDQSNPLPVLRARTCPYPGLAEQDRGICALERMMLSEMVGSSLRLSECRLDGDSCCRFEAAGALN